MTNSHPEPSRPLRSATYLLHFTPAEKVELERKAALYHARTGQRLTLASALRIGARAHLDELLAQTDESAEAQIAT